MKSVVWPPPNPPEDEPPLNIHDQIAKNTTAATKKIFEATQHEEEKSNIKNSINKKDSTNLTNIEKFVSVDQDMMSQSASATISTATMASAITSTSVTETIVQSQQSQEIKESSTTVSYSEQKTSESQSLAMYHSQTSQPIQTCYEKKENTETESIVDAMSTVIEQNQQTIMSSNTNDSIKKRSGEIKATDSHKKISPQPETSATDDDNVNKTCIKVEKDEIFNNSTMKIEDIKQSVTNSKTEEIVSVTKTIATTTDSNSIQEIVGEKNTVESNPNTSLLIKSVPVPEGCVPSMVDALTTAPDRPFSPLPPPPPPVTFPTQNTVTEVNKEKISNEKDQKNTKETIIREQSPMFTQSSKIGITPIPPVKPYNPAGKKEDPVPMPPETTPYIPPDFKIIIEPKVSREMCSSPMIEALTTAPDRPFTPILTQSIERGSLRDALTIAPDRAYSPLPLNVINQSSHFSSSTASSATIVQSTISEIARPIATQTSSEISQQVHSEMSTMQNTCKLQTSTGSSAFKPVIKQTFPPPQPEEYCKMTSFPLINNESQTSYIKSQNHQAIISESKSMQHSTITSSSMNTQSFSSVKSTQNFFEQLDHKETMSSTAVRSKSGLHKPDNIPPYQKHFDQLPSQRGITPEICNAPAILQHPVTPTTDPPSKPREKSQDRNNLVQPIHAPQVQTPKFPQQKPIAAPPYFHNENPISMTFQPVNDDLLLRASPIRSRSTTPSLINKPAPIIPHYQMNLVTVEHLAPDTHLYEPSSPDTSRSPTPKLRSRSPAQGPPPNPLKAQAPRIKENTPQRQAAHSLLTQATANLRKEHEVNQKGFQSNVQVFNASGAKNWGQNQPSVIKEQKQSKVGYHSESYDKGDTKIKEDSMTNQNFSQKQTQSKSVVEYGNTTVQTSRKSFEEFESKQSAKVIEIHKGGSFSSNQFQSNTSANNTKPKQVFPPPVMNLSSTQQNLSINQASNVTNTGNILKICEPNPTISGANQDPVCDPTPSTGSSVGAAARGKTFGVSSAPKRGRGVLNKAALPGSRVPLCGSCNGNIR